VVRIFASSTVSVSSGGGTLSQLDTTPEFYCCRAFRFSFRQAS
jgi:hypothetical protein